MSFEMSHSGTERTYLVNNICTGSSANDLL